MIKIELGKCYSCNKDIMEGDDVIHYDYWDLLQDEVKSLQDEVDKLQTEIQKLESVLEIANEAE